jgi:hypothetical protein
MTNTHPDFCEVFDDFKDFVSTSTEGCDPISMWSAAATLAEFVRAYANQQSRTLTASVEPGTLAQFRSLLVDVNVFLEGFADCRIMRERSAEAAASGLTQLRGFAICA